MFSIKFAYFAIIENMLFKYLNVYFGMAPISYNGLFEVSLFSDVDFISNKNDCRINEMKDQENLLVITSGASYRMKTNTIRADNPKEI